MTTKFKYSVVIAKSKKNTLAEQTGVFGDGWNHHFQHTKLQSMGKLQITH
jgi:hypothetical protein